MVWDGTGPFPGLFWVRKIQIMSLLRLQVELYQTVR